MRLPTCASAEIPPREKSGSGSADKEYVRRPRVRNAQRIAGEVTALTREQKYKEQLEELGIYSPAFDPEIHTLSEMERDLQKIRKEWKAMGSPINSGWYDAIVKQRRDILAHRDALGLTPKSLRRFRPEFGGESNDLEEEQQTVLGFIQERYE